MIFQTTYVDKKITKAIDDLVGKSFSLIQRFKMGGIGSKRMIIDDVSPNLRSYMNTVSDINYGSIELRPNGIIVAVNKGLSIFKWVIPYYQFYIYKTNGISIHAQGRFIHFKNNRTHKENKSFFEKLTRLKIEYDLKYPHIDSI